MRTRSRGVARGAVAAQAEPSAPDAGQAASACAATVRPSPRAVGVPRLRLAPAGRTAGFGRRDAAAREPDATRCYLDDIGARRLLEPAEELRLARRARSGDLAARDALLVHNLRLVVFVARRYLDRGLPLLDLVAEGNLGLMHAVDRFDPERGARLSTYAVWWIREQIELALIRQSRAIRLPVHVAKAVKRWKRSGRRLGADLDTAAGAAAVAAHQGGDADAIRNALRRAEAPLSTDLGGPVEEALAESAEASPEACAQRHAVARQVARWLERLPERHRRVLAHRYGLDGMPEATLAEVAAMLGLTAERVRQLQKDALARMAAQIRREGIEPAVLL